MSLTVDKLSAEIAALTRELANAQRVSGIHEAAAATFREQLEATEAQLRTLVAALKLAYDTLPDVEASKLVILNAVAPLDTPTDDDIAWAREALGAPARAPQEAKRTEKTKI